VIDQYQVSTDKRSGITNDPNRPDNPEYIIRLLGQVITVSLETVKIVKSLPLLSVAAAEYYNPRGMKSRRPTSPRPYDPRPYQTPCQPSRQANTLKGFARNRLAV
jgi:hypothetical protein